MFINLTVLISVNQILCAESKPINCEITRKCSTEYFPICTAFGDEYQTFNNTCIYENSYCTLQPANKSKYLFLKYF